MTSPESKSRKSRKASLRDTPVPSDFADLLRESEERLKTFIEDRLNTVTEKLTKIESALSAVQTECTRLDSEVTIIRDAICKQQLQLEANERKLREKNLILHNIPEEDVITSTDQLKNDNDKVLHICRVADIDVKKDDIAVVRRLGKRVAGKARPLKLELTNSELKFKFLNKRKDVIGNQNIQTNFKNKVFINPDNSFFVQLEEQRLRKHLAKLKEEFPSRPSYIKSGVLYHEGSEVDRVDVRKQLL